MLWLGSYSDVPHAYTIYIVIASFILHWLLFHFTPIPAAIQSFSSSSSSSSNDNNTKRHNSRSLSQHVIRNYIVSAFHAAITVIAVLTWFIFYDWDLIDIHRGIVGGTVSDSHQHPTGDLYQPVCVAFTLGYFLYDTTCMYLYKDTASTSSYIHHLCIGSAFILSLLCDNCLPFQFYMLLEELSTDRKSVV